MSAAGKLEGFKLGGHHLFPVGYVTLRSARAGTSTCLVAGRGGRPPMAAGISGAERPRNGAALQPPRALLCLALLRGQWPRALGRFLSIPWLVPAPGPFLSYAAAASAVCVSRGIHPSVSLLVSPPGFCCFVGR
ncbi:hypothetical protein SEVIR_5G424450v4 [Setaria viridis]